MLNTFNKQQKPREEMSQQERYITLLGDPIHQSTAKSLLTGSDLKLVALAPAFAAVCAEIANDPEKTPLGAGAETLLYNLHDMVMRRFLFEKIFTNQFNKQKSFLLDNEALSNLCIDKYPDPEMTIKSVVKYGSAIKKARMFYGVFSAVGVGFSGVSLISGFVNGDMKIPAEYLAHKAVSLNRDLRGFHRFNKCASGEWAIVNMPEPEKVTEKETKKFEHEAYMPA